MSKKSVHVSSDRRGFSSAFVPHERVTVSFPDDGLTRQEFADETDINVLMSRYEKGLTMPNPQRPPDYFDAADLPVDFQEAMNMVIAAEDAFMALPATARRDLGNDPAQFVAFASDPKNIDRMREWGLAPPAEAPPAPLSVRVIPDAEAPPAPPKAS